MEGESERRRTPSFIDKIMEEQKIMLSQSDLFKQIIQIFFLLGIVGLIPYYFLWHFTYFEQTSPTNALTELFIALGILVVALLLRDINYILWILLKKERRKKTSFMFDLRLFKISCRYNETLSKVQYRSFLLFPFLLWGMIPVIISLINGNFACLVFGCVMSVACSDCLAIWKKIRFFKNDDLFHNFPDHTGFIALQKASNQS